jgi:hypothetical protein
MSELPASPLRPGDPHGHLLAEAQHTLDVWRAVVHLARADKIVPAGAIPGELVEIEARLRWCVGQVEREGDQGSAASIATATMNRMRVLFGRMRANLERAIRIR